MRTSRWKSYQNEFEQLTQDTFEGAFFTSDLRIAYYNRKHRDKMVLSTIDTIYMLPVTIYFLKQSCLVEAVNREISSLTSSGLISYWVRFYMNPRFAGLKFVQEANASDALHLDQFYGILQICCGLYLVAIGVFLGELLAKRFGFLKFFLDILTY